MTPHMVELVRDFVGAEGGTILEIGSFIEANQGHMDLRLLFRNRLAYVGVDVNPGPGVDRITNVLMPEQLEDLLNSIESLRVTLCLYVLEHVWEIQHACDVLGAIWRRHPESWLLVATHQNQPFHGTPKYGDYWRLTLDGLKKLMETAGVPDMKFFGHGEGNPDDVLAIRQPLSGVWPAHVAARQIERGWSQW